MTIPTTFSSESEFKAYFQNLRNTGINISDDKVYTVVVRQNNTKQTLFYQKTKDGRIIPYSSGGGGVDILNSEVVDIVGDRNLDTVYQNDSNSPLFVQVAIGIQQPSGGDEAYAQLVISPNSDLSSPSYNSAFVGNGPIQNAEQSDTNLTGLVPIGWYYKIITSFVGTGAVVINSWNETKIVGTVTAGTPLDAVESDKTSERIADGTVYQNITGKPLFVFITVTQQCPTTSDQAELDADLDSVNPPNNQVDACTIQNINGGSAFFGGKIVMIVPQNWYYKVSTFDSGSGVSSVERWIEYELEGSGLTTPSDKSVTREKFGTHGLVDFVDILISNNINGIDNSAPWFMPFDLNLFTPVTDETPQQIPAFMNGKINQVIFTNPAGSGTSKHLTITFRVNGVDAGTPMVIPDSDVTPLGTRLVFPINAEFEAGDMIDWKLETDDASGFTGISGNIRLEYDYDG